MSRDNWTWTVRKTLPSRPGAHVPCMLEILEKLTESGWDGRDLFGVELTLEESLTNAIRHGNRLDESKQVVVECKLNSERFWLRVKDEGTGFRPGDVPDCTAKENLECPGGRGLALIRAFMTNVEYNKQGNCVTMEKARTQPAPREPSGRTCEPGESRPE